MSRYANLGASHPLDSPRITRRTRFVFPIPKAHFIGRDAVLRTREAGVQRRMLQFRLTEPEPMLFHNEAILRDGEMIGVVTSANYGHALGAAIGMGYVPCTGESVEQVLASDYSVEIAGTRVSAIASLAPMYDPKSERMKG